MKGIDVFVKIWGNAKKKKDKKFRSLEVRGKLIALKKKFYDFCILVILPPAGSIYFAIKWLVKWTR